MAYHINEELGDIYYEVIGDQLILKIRDGILGRGCDIYIIKSDDTTVPSDDTVFSSKRTLEEIAKRAGEGGGYWEMKEDSSGNKYIYTQYPMVSQYGATFYAGAPIGVGSIYEGLPIDNDTIYWQEYDNGVKILKAKGGGEGSTFNSAEMWRLLGAPSAEQINSTHISTALQPYATTNSVNQAISEVTRNFVTINTEQEISAAKHFLQGLSVGANKHKLYEKDGVVYFDGDLAVTGGITQYATDGVSVSTIMDGVTADEVTITKGSDNVLRIKNAGSGSSFDKAAMWAALAANTTEPIHKSHLTTALQGYATESWANSNFLGINSNAASASKLQTARTIWGQLFDGTNNVSGNMTNVGLINDSIRIEGGFDKATIRGNGHGIIFGGGNGYAHCTYAFRPEWGSQSETQCNLIIQNASAATSNPSYITTHEFVNDGSAYHRTRVRVARTDGEGSGIYTNTIHASDWFRSEGNSGWYSETWGGGIYMNDFTWVRTYNGKNFKSDNVVEAGTWLSAGIAVNVFGPVGNSWNNGQGAFQVGIPNDGNQTPILVAYNGPANSSSGTNRYFAIEVLNTGTRDVHFCVTGAETVRMRSNWFEVNGNFYATDNVTGRLIYRDVATTGVSAANYFLDSRPAIKCEQDLSVIANDTVRPILRWGDAVSNVGYNTRYVIGSVRQGSDWGRIFMAVSNNDNGTSEGCSFSVYGSGYAAVNGNFLATGGITQYSDQRAKTIIEQISLSLMDIADAPAIRFKWNGWKQKDDGKTHIGGIAQYVQNVLPEAIYNSDDVLTMDYATTGYIFAVQTAKHLLSYETKTDKEIKQLKKRVKYLEKQLKKLGYEEIGTLDN